MILVGRPVKARFAVVAGLAIVTAACYLPRVDVERDVSTFILASVTQCAAEVVGGEVRNDADVPVRVVLNVAWLDIASEPFYELELELPRIEAESTEQWNIAAQEELDSPIVCTAEAFTVEALE